MINKFHYTKLLIFSSLLFTTQILWSEESAEILSNQLDSKNQVKVETKKHRIDVGGVLYNIVSADTVYSYLYKFSLMGGGHLGYSYLGETIRHRVNFDAGAGRLLSPYFSDPDYPALSDLAFQFLLNYQVAFPVWEEEKLQLWIGPGLHFFGNGWIPDNEYDILRYAWNLHLGTGFYSELDWNLADLHQFNFSFYLPILGVAWRPPYSGYTLKEESILEEDGILTAAFSNPDFVSFHNMFSFDLVATYIYTINDLLDLNVKYLFGVTYLTIPRERIDIENNITVNISFKL